MAHADDNIMFAEFKTKLQSFEETEKIRAAESSESVMKTRGKTGQWCNNTSIRGGNKDDKVIVCCLYCRTA